MNCFPSLNLPDQLFHCYILICALYLETDFTFLETKLSSSSTLFPFLYFLPTIFFISSNPIFLNYSLMFVQSFTFLFKVMFIKIHASLINHSKKSHTL